MTDMILDLKPIALILGILGVVFLFLQWNRPRRFMGKLFFYITIIFVFLVIIILGYEMFILGEATHG